MKTRKLSAIIMAALITAAMLTACSTTNQYYGTSAEEGASTVQNVTDDTAESTAEESSADESSEEAASSSEKEKSGADKSEDSSDGEYFTKRDLSGEYDESDAVEITLSDTTFKASGDGVSVDKNVLTISKEGVYILSGTIKDGRIVIAAGDSDKVQLVLNSCSITSSDYSAIFVESADKVFVTTAKGTENTITDGKTYSSAAEESGADAAIYSKSDLVINGSGTLNVTGNLSHAVVSKDDLKITGGTISAEAAESAVCGKDSVRIANADITIKSGADAIKATNTEDTAKGYIYIESGTINVTAEGDVLSAESDIIIAGGTISAQAGGGSSNSQNTHENDFMMSRNNAAAASSTSTEDESDSTKGLKAGGSVTIKDGTIDLNCADDTVHAGGSVTISGGKLTFASGDDGIHSDDAVTISGGTVSITESYEGIEGKNVTISGGEVIVTAEDDGMNATDGTSEGGMGGFGGMGGMMQDSASSDVFLLISGGTVHVNADGDGLDSNGVLTISGGTIYVDGPTNSGNGALDSGSGAVITGGTIIAVGSSGMAESFGTSSTQGSILYNLDESHQAGEQITLTDSSGKELLTYKAAKTFNSVVISTPEVTASGTYTLTVGSKQYTIEMSTISYSNGGSMMGGGMDNMGGMGGFGGFGRPDENSGERPDFGSAQGGFRGGRSSSTDASQSL